MHQAEGVMVVLPYRVALQIYLYTMQGCKILWHFYERGIADGHEEGRQEESFINRDYKQHKAIER